MMTEAQIKRATREELAEELGAGCEYTEDWETAGLDELRDRVRALVARYKDDDDVRDTPQAVIVEAALAKFEAAQGSKALRTALRGFHRS